MTLLDNIGEATLKFLQRAFYYSLGFLIKLIEIGRRANQRINIYGIFEKRGIDIKHYVILQSQVAMVPLLILTIVFVFSNFIPLRTYIIAAILTGGYILYVLIYKMKRLFEDYSTYRDYLLSFVGMLLFLAIIKITIPIIPFPIPQIHFIVISLFFLIIIQFIKKRHERNYTFGMVLDKRTNEAEVKIDYDIRSGVKRGIYFIKDTLNVKKGDVVKVLVKKKWSGLRGSMPVELLEVSKKEG